ncbi:MAG: hypothetical protein ABIE42_11780 [Candidatus Eisenbacteria bacterium]
MRRAVIAVVLVVAISVLAVEPVLAEEGSIPLGPANPTARVTLPRHEYPGSCDEAARLELRQAGLGTTAPPGHESDPFYEFSGRACDLQCSPCSYFEGEPVCVDEFVDSYNGGCNSTPYVFETLLPSYGLISVCATSGTYLYGGGDYRDTDWYEMEITQQTIITWTTIGEFPLLMFLIDGTGGCGAYTILEMLEVPECEEGIMQHTLSPGTYWFVVVPTVFSGIPCGVEYIMTLDGFHAAPDCAAPCPMGSVLEEEPSCGPEYYDGYNGGCNSYPSVFSDLDPAEYIVLCGETGVYPYTGMCYRDTDWFELVLDEPREIDFCIMAGFDYQLLILQELDDCFDYPLLYSLTGPPCDVACETYALDPGTYWLWVGSWSWVPVDCGRSYVVTIGGYTTPVEDRTWGSVKALYR